MTEKKSTLPSQRNQDWKKSQGKNKKSKKSLTNILTSSITELNEQIYVRVKLICDKIVFSKEPEQKYKTWIGKLDKKKVKIL